MNIPILTSKKILASGGSLEIEGNVNIVGRLSVGSKTLPLFISEEVATAVTSATLYTWIKYSPNANGNNLTDEVNSDSRYIGFAYNKNDSNESSNPSDYSWSLFKGEDGQTNISMILSNENVTFSADFDGIVTPTDYENSRSSISILEGSNILKHHRNILNYNRAGNELILNAIEDLVGDFLFNGEWIVYKVSFENISPLSQNPITIDYSLDYVTTNSATQMSSDSAKITYLVIVKNSIGQIVKLNKTQTFSKSKIGPGVLYRGEYAAQKLYFHSPKRRDAVFYNPDGLWENSYWLTANTSYNGEVWPAPRPKELDFSNPWTPFGAQFSSIATGIIISEESYVKNTINVGTNAFGDGANIILYGGNEKPWMSIGQGSTAAAYGASGIWMGIDSDSAPKISIGDAQNYLKWNGQNLEIKGSINIVGGIGGVNFFRNGNFELPNISTFEEQYNIESADIRPNLDGIVYPKSGSNLAAFVFNSGNSYVYIKPSCSVEPNTQYILSFYHFNYGDEGTASHYYLKLSDINGTPRFLNVPRTWEFSWHKEEFIFTTNSTDVSLEFRIGRIGELIIGQTSWTALDLVKLEKGNNATDWSESPDDINSKFLTDSTGKLNKTALPITGLNGKGLYLGKDHLGYYDGSSWKTYMADDGTFYLSGTSEANSLLWDGNELIIKGQVDASSGNVGGWDILDNKLVSTDSRIVLDAIENSISLRDSGNNLRFLANSLTSLPSLTGASILATVQNTKIETLESTTSITKISYVNATPASITIGSGEYSLSYTYKPFDISYDCISRGVAYTSVDVKLVLSTTPTFNSGTISYTSPSTINATTQPNYDHGFGPLLSNFISVWDQYEQYETNSIVFLTYEVDNFEVTRYYIALRSNTSRTPLNVTPFNNSDWFSLGTSITFSGNIVGKYILILKSANTKSILTNSKIQNETVLIGGDYYIGLQITEYISIPQSDPNVIYLDASDLVDDFENVSYSGSGSTHFQCDGSANSVSIKDLSALTIINGGGFQSAASATKYLKVFDGEAVTNKCTSHSTLIGGGLRADSIEIGANLTTAEWWKIKSDSDGLKFKYQDGTTGGFISKSRTNVNAIDFTGQHRSISNDIDVENSIGLIVSSTGKYDNLSGGTNPTVNESLPIVELSKTINDKRVFGVISDKEDLSDGIRQYASGAWITIFETNETNSRAIINSLGEGGIWITNIGGNLDNGDYITSSNIPGFGMKQQDDLLHNYTVAKITEDCHFSDETKYLEFSFNEITYRKQFVGCTYHCG